MSDYRYFQYIGNKPVKPDNVAKTGIIWNGKGDIKAVPAGAADRLLSHPDIWVEVPRRVAEDVAKGFGVVTVDVIGDQYAEKCSDAMAVAKVDGDLAYAAMALGNTDALTIPADAPPIRNDDTPDPLPPEDDVVITAEDVKSAIFTLDRANPEHFTETGKPRVKAVSAAIGQTVTAALVAEAWAEIDG